MAFIGKEVFIFAMFITGVLGAPFLSEDEANQFIRLKRQATGYWDPNSRQNVWGYTIAEQVNEHWTQVRTTAQYYMDLGSIAFDYNTAQEHIRAYMDMLRQTDTLLQQQLRQS
ncbi:uncharacterized protein C3orf85-like [Latimeria chalumnae]|uniref:uncharacterized protein C3orf85-like n=1 Tax=Latimeria chalumnae TaxID=7897 RepID=UPI0006D8F454|nr:PREDICTED: uncharacterized protein LOC106704520 [Latimeria chalumnae]|eukprot:XP_014347203.1 PREDICTED: uncharacterized protein LOC106704520 [Latimeria chalumnae]